LLYLPKQMLIVQVQELARLIYVIDDEFSSVIPMYGCKMVFIVIFISTCISNIKLNQLLSFLFRMKLDQTFMSVSLHIFTYSYTHQKHRH